MKKYLSSNHPFIFCIYAAVFSCLLFFSHGHIAALSATPWQLIDFEKDMLDDFVLMTKKIDIPGYPDAFNSSMIPWKQSLLMSFRTGSACHDLCDDVSSDEHAILMSFRTRDPVTLSTNGIGLIVLDENFDPISTPQVLYIPHINPAFTFRQQDPRLVAVGEKIYIAYSNMIEGEDVPEVRRMFIAELHYDGHSFYTSEPETITDFESENSHRWQKNWVPFDYNGDLMLAYSISPHTIFKPMLDKSGICTTVCSTKTDVHWPWGTLRGGTPALLEDDGEYLSFFHSSIDMFSAHSFGKKITHYFMGAYTFSSKPPFAVTRISPKPIVGSNFYCGPIYTTWKPLRCVFPCGYFSSKEYIWITYGRQDHEVWVTKLDKKKLYDSLIAAASSPLLNE